MGTKRHKILPVFSSQLTSTVSVALVLFILGVTALLGIAARSATTAIREQTGFVVIMSSDATEIQINRLKSLWTKAPYVSDAKYASADEVMRRWRDMMGTADLPTEEDLGGNPFFPEFEVNLRADYAVSDSVEHIVDRIKKYEGVGEVKLYGDTIDTMNRSIHSVMIILVIIAGALLLISFVLINNTVRLAIYSRRFLIHTMKLVGATAGFIRRPFVADHLIGGIIAAFLASGSLAALLYYLTTIEPEVGELVPWSHAGWVFGGMFAAGALITGLAALFGANRYIRISYDDMFD